MTRQNRTVVVARAGGPDALEIRTEPMPTPRPDEVLIEVHMAGINRHDCNQRKAGPGHAATDVLGLEVAGRVVSVGRPELHHLVGKRVCALVDGGGYAEFSVADAELCFELPEDMTDSHAASLPESLFTTWFNFFEIASLPAGGLALIHGGTSGVATVATQALASLGFKVMTTCGDDGKCLESKALGAIASCNYKSESLADDLLNASDGRLVDVVMDMSAGAHIDTDLAVIAINGTIVHLSAGGNREMPVPLARLMARRAKITGAFLRATPIELKRRLAARIKAEIWPDIMSAVRPVIAATFPLSDAVKAHAFMENDRHIGKVLIEPTS